MDLKREFQKLRKLMRRQPPVNGLREQDFTHKIAIIKFESIVSFLLLLNVVGWRELDDSFVYKVLRIWTILKFSKNFDF